MAPWCNRITAAPTAVGSQLVALPPTFEDGTAIHGQVHSAPWRLDPDGTLRLRGGGDGWPWPYECSLRASVAGPVLILDLVLTNLAATPMPAGIGLHPWFHRPLDVRIDARRVIASNLDPGAVAQPVVGELDLRTMRPMPDDLDAAWLALGDPAVELRWPGLGIAAELSASCDAPLDRGRQPRSARRGGDRAPDPRSVGLGAVPGRRGRLAGGARAGASLRLVTRMAFSQT